MMRGSSRLPIFLPSIFLSENHVTRQSPWNIWMQGNRRNLLVRKAPL